MELQRQKEPYASAQNSIEDGQSRVHHFNKPIRGYVIANDGQTDIKIKLLGETFTVNPKSNFQNFSCRLPR